MTPHPLSSAEPWDLVAEAYGTELLPAFEPYARDALALARLSQGAAILDVATGPGTLAVMAANDGARVTALDLSPEMIVQLRARAAAGGVTVDAQVGDGQALPFDDATFDAAFSLFGLMFFPDRAAAFHQLWRVLRPTGRAVVASWAPFEGPFPIAMENLRAHLPGFPFGTRKPPLGDPDELTTEMRAAGFADVAVHATTHLLVQPSLQAFWQSAQRTTPGIALVRRTLGETRWAEVAAGVHADLERQFGPGPVHENATALIGVGVKA